MSNDEEIQFQDDEAVNDADTTLFLEAIEKLKKRCTESNIAFDVIDFDDGDKFLQIQIPSGRDAQPLLISSLRKAGALISVNFEKYIILKGYDAICSYSDGTIEALIRQNSPSISQTNLFRLLFGVDIREEGVIPSEIILRPNDEPSEIQISLGTVSLECSIITGNYSAYSTSRGLSVRISGLNISQHDQAVELLERIADSLFFEFDLSTGISLSLGRTKKFHVRRFFNRPKSKVELTFPKYEYNHDAMLLYWYARGAQGMPLLQYLAYYQVIEVYFPTYSRLDAQKRVRSILKNPSFNPMSDLDIGRILTSIRASRNKGFGDERSQLKATIQECVTPEGVRSFLKSENTRAEFFESKQKTISDYRIPLANPDADLRNDIADRIYDIRCKIVHTKDVGETDEETVGLLLPFSKEADLLTFDIELIQYLAQQVFITSSTNLRYILHTG